MTVYDRMLSDKDYFVSQVCNMMLGSRDFFKMVRENMGGRDYEALSDEEKKRVLIGRASSVRVFLTQDVRDAGGEVYGG